MKSFFILFGIALCLYSYEIYTATIPDALGLQNKDKLKKDLVFKYLDLLSESQDQDAYQYFECTSSEYKEFKKKMAEEWKEPLFKVLRAIQQTDESASKQRIKILAVLFKEYITKKLKEGLPQGYDIYDLESKDIRKNPLRRSKAMYFINGIEEVYQFSDQYKISLLSHEEFNTYYNLYRDEKIE